MPENKIFIDIMTSPVKTI